MHKQLCTGEPMRPTWDGEAEVEEVMVNSVAEAVAEAVAEVVAEVVAVEANKM